MALTTIKDESNFKPLEPIAAGSHLARCFRMIELGTKDKTYLGKKTGTKVTEVHISFELPHELYVRDPEKGEETRVIGKRYPVSMNVKSNLRKMLETWRTVAYTDEEIETGVDITGVLNGWAFLSLLVEPNKKDPDLKKNTIGAITPLPKGTQAPTGEFRPTLLIQIEDFVNHYKTHGSLDSFEGVPTWIKTEVLASDEIQDLTADIGATPTIVNPLPEGEPDSNKPDGLPF